MFSKEIIKEICTRTKNTDYLAKKNIHPQADSGNKLKYCCPVHEGDNTPSFIVYMDDEVENFFCFGCKAGFNILHLYSKLERVSFREAFLKLSEGIDFSVESSIDSIIEDLVKEPSKKELIDPGEVCINLNKALFYYVNNGKDPEREEISEKFFKHLDSLIDSQDLASIYKLYDIVPQLIIKRTLINEQRNKSSVA